MKILGLLNPSGWIGQIIVLLFFVSIGVIGGIRLHMGWVEPCPPTTQTNINQTNKVKKGSTMTNDVTGIQQIDCEEWLKGLSNREVKDIRK